MGHQMEMKRTDRYTHLLTTLCSCDVRTGKTTGTMHSSIEWPRDKNAGHPPRLDPRYGKKDWSRVGSQSRRVVGENGRLVDMTNEDLSEQFKELFYELGGDNRYHTYYV
jgi:hypothetical protein